MNLAEFRGKASTFVGETNRQTQAYLDEHVVRFHRTYLACMRQLRPDARMLSIGAGSAYVECVIASTLPVRMTVLDFPDAIAAHKAVYDKLNFETIEVNIRDFDSEAVGRRYDLILSAEIIEHIPEAPSRQIAKFKPLLAERGVFIITTPNLGNLRNLVKFGLQMPVMEEPEFAFSPPSFENEQYHRREYMPVEIETAFLRCGLRPEKVEFCMNSLRRTYKDYAFGLFEAAVGRFRRTQIITARSE